MRVSIPDEPRTSWRFVLVEWRDLLWSCSTADLMAACAVGQLHHVRRMIKSLILTFFIMSVVVAEENPGFAIFNGQKIVWENQPPKFDGTHHGDGVVTFPIIGYVLTFDDRDAIIPVAGAQVIQIPANNFGGVKEPAAVCVSDAAGKVEFTVSLEAAIQIGGKHDGQVYQSTRQDYIIRAPGYKDRTISLCLNHPPFKVFIRKP